MPNRILVLFAHPLLEKSRVNRILFKVYSEFPEVVVNDLYQNYPEFNIDTEYEKSLLLDCDVALLHHPFYWYSSPPIIKQWIDMVLEVGWAYGPGGNALQGKFMMQLITAGGPKSAYSREGNNKYSVREFLLPFQQTARLCKMNYLPPFVVHGTHRLSRKEISEYSDNLRSLLRLLTDSNLTEDRFYVPDYFNEIIEERGIHEQ